ncbi:molybdenum cofactor synthesis 2B [Leptinotarsa decemlineata]|uniref:molybdenum cofactor synthesis 2B n=1 Tax=Leptinotarsa decemlineata TaxID=7539 RepID=UPI003D30BE79
MNHLKLTKEKLSSDSIIDLVKCNTCGAISLFIGTTRDNSEGKNVITLEYEAYESMALKAMEKLCEEIRDKWPTVQNIAIYHRLGLVPVKEMSIIIGISSPHREEAIKATNWCIDNVKKSVPIWKKEIYADSESQWKENKELNQRRRRTEINQSLERLHNSPYSTQVKAKCNDIKERLLKFQKRKIRENYLKNQRETLEDMCLKSDTAFEKKNGSNSHLEVNQTVNSYQHRDQRDFNYMAKIVPSNGIEERLENAEFQLSINNPVPKNIYQRLQVIEDRLLHLESSSPEYIQLWDKMTVVSSVPMKKKIFSIEEIDYLIAETEKKVKAQQISRLN